MVVTPATVSIYPGMTARFKAQVVGQSNQALKWSLDAGIAVFTAISRITEQVRLSGSNLRGRY